MRKQVYVKFAEALDAQRRDRVYVKFAEALDAQMHKKALSIGGAMRRAGRAVKALSDAASPKIDASKWKRFDPRRLFVTTKKIPIETTNTPRVPIRPGTNVPYGTPGGAPRTFDELPNSGGFREETRLSPAKILAAIAGGTGAGMLVSGKGTGRTGGPDTVVDGGKGMRKLLTALGIGVGAAGTAGAVGYAASRRKGNDDEEKKRKEK